MKIAWAVACSRIRFLIRGVKRNMGTKKLLALVYGGDSLEWEISVLSGRHVASHIDKNKYDVYEILLRGNDWRVVKMADGCEPEGGGVCMDKEDFSFRWDGVRVRFDVVLVMIHGTPGEDGILQSYLEALGIPHTSSSASVSALAFDKYACKCYLRGAGILMAKDVLIKERGWVDAQAVVDQLGLPLFVKPNYGGSSFGITKVQQVDELQPAVERAFRECSSVLVEECIQGRELTNGVLKTATRQVVLPVTEIVPDNDFFDYEAKYEGASREITPALIPDALRDQVQQLTSKIYDYLGCKGFIRVDYIVREGGGTDGGVGDTEWSVCNTPLLLEVNTVPGMTPMSLVPQQVRAAGMSLESFVELLIEDALARS